MRSTVGAVSSYGRSGTTSGSLTAVNESDTRVSTNPAVTASPAGGA